jgi:hypothetical protein
VVGTNFFNSLGMPRKLRPPHPIKLLLLVKQPQTVPTLLVYLRTPPWTPP